MGRNLQSTNAAKEYWKCKQEVKISQKSIYQELGSELFEERQINLNHRYDLFKLKWFLRIMPYITECFG